MAFTKFQYFLAFLLVVTGSINTLTTKWTDRFEAKGADGKIHAFQHPFFQACTMFLGEMLCLLVFKIMYFYFSRRQDRSISEINLLRGNQSFNPFILLPPALCDMCATSLMYVGLTLTYASSFQMLRGAVIVFVGIFSKIFLGRKLKIREWFGIFLVICGLVVVGLSDIGQVESSQLNSTPTIGSDNTMLENNGTSNVTRPSSDVILGDAIVIGAQGIAAIQMVWEEKFVSGLDIPAMQAVGWEGVFGFTVLGALQVPFYFIKVPPPFSNNSHDSLEDIPDAFVQMKNENLIIVAVLGTVFSIAFFNYSGISVTKEISATSRMVLDSFRTFVIWMVSLALGWQKFHWLQVVGFTILLSGMCTYNNVLIPQITKCLKCNSSSEPSDEEQLISEEADKSPDDVSPSNL